LSAASYTALIFKLIRTFIGCLIFSFSYSGALLFLYTCSRVNSVMSYGEYFYFAILSIFLLFIAYTLQTAYRVSYADMRRGGYNYIYDSTSMRPLFNSHSTAIRPRHDQSMTYVTTVYRPTCIWAAGLRPKTKINKQVTAVSGSAASGVTSV